MTWGWILFVVIWNNINTKCMKIWIEMLKKDAWPNNFFWSPAVPSLQLEETWKTEFDAVAFSESWAGLTIFNRRDCASFSWTRLFFSQRIYSQEQYLASQRVLEISSLLSLFKSDFNWYIIKPSIYYQTNNCFKFSMNNPQLSLFLGSAQRGQCWWLRCHSSLFTGQGEFLLTIWNWSIVQLFFGIYVVVVMNCDWKGWFCVVFSPHSSSFSFRVHLLALQLVLSLILFCK